VPGQRAVRQRGSQIRLRHPDKPVPLVVPLTKELKRGTLAGILPDFVSMTTSCAGSTDIGQD